MNGLPLTCQQGVPLVFFSRALPGRQEKRGPRYLYAAIAGAAWQVDRVYKEAGAVRQFFHLCDSALNATRQRR